MALEYFQTGKYHECMLLLEKLDKQYRLNPRFRAYLGVCYYYEWDYEKAYKLLDALISELRNFAPHERSVYYWACAESHFNMKQFAAAIPLYGDMLKVCHENEKPDALYRLGFCHMFQKAWQPAYDCFNGALALYRKYRQEDQKPRIAQIENMMVGIKEHLPKPKSMADNTRAALSPQILTVQKAPIPAMAIPRFSIKMDSIKTKSVVKFSAVRDTLKGKETKDINLDNLFKSRVEVK
ncbi:hypothetical protein SAMN05216383_103101 [Prevotella sp. KH2C16]|nr:hypothetical protein SAMN05216383_103101 [Prevotella sp. KH2C16]